MSAPACLFVCALLQAGAVPAAPPAPPPVSEVVVEGRGPGPTPEQKAHAVVEAITRFSATDDIIVRRFYAPCLKVVGAKPPYADGLAERLKAATALVGLPAARPGCLFDVLVVFTPDVERFIAKSELRYWTGWGLGFVAARRRSGPRAPRAVATFKVFVEAPYQSGGGASRIRSRVVDRYDRTVVVVRADLAQRTAAQTLGDYLAMLALTSADETSVSPQASILNLLADKAAGPPPTELTAWDRAYLAAYYKALPDMPASVVMGQIARQMLREAGGAP